MTELSQSLSIVGAQPLLYLVIFGTFFPKMTKTRHISKNAYHH